MGQSEKILLCVSVGFLIYITAKGELKTYLGFFI